MKSIDGPVTGAGVKFFNFSMNSPVINYYANDIKVTAALSTTGAESGTTGLSYAAVYPAINSYAMISPGIYDLKATRPSTATADPNLVINKWNAKLEEGKNYSLYLCGFYNTAAKSSDAFLLEDVLPPIDTAATYVRFVHASPNANPVNFFMKNKTTGQEVSIASSVAYKTGSVFVKMPQGVYNLIIRYPSTTTDLYTREDVSVNKSNTYTFTLRGDITIGGTTATNRTFIDNTPNR